MDMFPSTDSAKNAVDMFPRTDINLPMYKIQSLLKEFNNTSGYYDIFIPAMKRLSTSYTEYYRQLEIANDKLLKQYPDIERLNSWN